MMNYNEEFEQEIATPEEDRKGFLIDNDAKADWAVKKIIEDQDEYLRIKAIADEQIEEIQLKLEAAKHKVDNSTDFLKNCLMNYFTTVPHKKTKTTEKYPLLSGTLVLKKGTDKISVDDDTLVPWLSRNGYSTFIKTKLSANWGDFKKKLDLSSGVAIVKDSGEIVPGITLTPCEDQFKIE